MEGEGEGWGGGDVSRLRLMCMAPTTAMPGSGHMANDGVLRPGGSVPDDTATLQPKASNCLLLLPCSE